MKAVANAVALLAIIARSAVPDDASRRDDAGHATTLKIQSAVAATAGTDVAAAPGTDSAAGRVGIRPPRRHPRYGPIDRYRNASRHPARHHPVRRANASHHHPHAAARHNGARPHQHANLGLKHGNVCYGDSPSGNRWLYLMPEHTGTDTAVRWLQRLAPDTCAHGHNLHPGQAPAKTSFAFLLVANPFKRVLTSAAFNKIIASARQRFPDRTRSDDVKAFNEWVLGLRSPPVRPQMSVLAGFPVKHVGFTVRLEAELQNVATRLGYDAPPPVTASHCVTSCEKGDKVFAGGGIAKRRNGTDAFRGTADFDLYYTTKAAQRVIQWYRADFDAFGFDDDVRTSPLGPVRNATLPTDAPTATPTHAPTDTPTAPTHAPTRTPTDAHEGPKEAESTSPKDELQSPGQALESGDVADAPSPREA
mmetsp:Transcript_30676/g.94952  ORF Transcript_30676/g.94952 Transcript_30676/m.94952 type:complete len:420 (+) Transcript_30676:187-1446(+)